MIDAQQFLTVLLSMLGAAGGAYGSIRFALGRLEARVDHVHEMATRADASANKAHDRIDNLHSVRER